VLLELAVFVPVLDLDEVLFAGMSWARLGTLLPHVVVVAVGVGGIEARTPSTMPLCTKPGSLRMRPPSSLPARRPQSMRAFSSVAMSSALKGTRLARRIVSSRDVAVTMCDEPAVSDV